MTRILQLIPFPSERPLNGGQIRAQQTRKALERAGYAVTPCPVYRAALHVNSMYQPPAIDPSTAQSVTRYQHIWQVYDLVDGEILARDAECFAAFEKLVEHAQPDVIMLEHPWLWPAVRKLYPSGRPPIIYNSYNLEAELKYHILVDANIDQANRLAAEVETLERELVGSAAAVSATTEADAAVYRTWTGSPVVVAPNGAERRARTALRGVLPDALRHWWQYLLFVASGHPPNGSGFAALALNGVINLRSNERVVVAGGVCSIIEALLRDRTAAATALDNDRLVLLGQVPQFMLDCLIENAAGLLLPITFGGGSNLKTAEALLAGHPIVATTKAFRGYETFASIPGVIIAETEQGFSAAMRQVLSGKVPSIPRDERLASLVWDRTLQPIVDLVGNVTSPHCANVASDASLTCSPMPAVASNTTPKCDFNIGSKSVRIMGVDAEIFGSLDDDYFIGLPKDLMQNGVFATETARLPPEGIVIDVGANIGTTALLAGRSVPQGHVIAVEPSPRAHACLTRTVAANLLANCTILHKCLGETEKEVPFVEAPFLAGSYVGTAGSSSPTTMVPMTTLDAIVAELALSRLDLVKIDVEGFELDVLKGGLQAIRRFRPRLVVEFNSFTLAANRRISPRSLLDFVLNEFGYFSTERDGTTILVKTESQIRDFLYSNMSHYIVDDIAFGG